MTPVDPRLGSSEPITENNFRWKSMSQAGPASWLGVIGRGGMNWHRYLACEEWKRERDT
jgi:hypothetical protein